MHRALKRWYESLFGDNVQGRSRERPAPGIPAELLGSILQQYRLDPLGVHGRRHWERVEKIGILLADTTRADLKVVSLFAYLHDARRENELVDPDHGRKAAEYAAELYDKKLLDITPAQFEQLRYACRHHSDVRRDVIRDMTVWTCWDSDRLDFWRITIKPDPAHLYTPAAKVQDTIEYARQLSLAEAALFQKPASA